MTIEDKKLALDFYKDDQGLVMETKVQRILGITPEYHRQIKVKLNIHTIKVPRFLGGERAYDYKKNLLKHAYEIADFVETGGR